MNCGTDCEPRAASRRRAIDAAGRRRSKALEGLAKRVVLYTTLTSFFSRPLPFSSPRDSLPGLLATAGGPRPRLATRDSRPIFERAARLPPMRASPPLLLLFLLHVLHADDTLATATTSPPSSLPLCRGDAYLAGAWVHDPSKTRAYPCCSAKGEASEMNDPTTAHCLKHDKAFPIYLGNYTRAEYSSSSTAPGARYVSRFDKYVYHSGKYPRVMGNGCSCQHAARAAGRPDDFVTEAERYTWRPTHCTLPPFNGAQFCDALGNRTLLLAGDSTMQQVHEHVGDTCPASCPAPSYVPAHTSSRHPPSVPLHSFAPLSPRPLVRSSARPLSWVRRRPPS